MSNVLLIAGGGTLGTYTADELLRLGHNVDIICLEDNASEEPRLKYYKADATVDYLKKLFSQKRYDGIVNFITQNGRNIFHITNCFRRTLITLFFFRHIAFTQICSIRSPKTLRSL